MSMASHSVYLPTECSFGNLSYRRGNSGPQKYAQLPRADPRGAGQSEQLRGLVYLNEIVARNLG